MASQKLSNYFAGAFSKPVTLMFDGDSKSLEPCFSLIWATAYQPLSIILNQANNLGVGGSDSSSSASTNLTHATRMATASAAISALAANGVVDVWLTMGTNDCLGSVAPEAVIANIRKYHNNVRIAGARFLIVMSVDPRATYTGTNAARAQALNAAYIAYCATVPDAFFCDPSPQILNPTSTTYACIGGTSPVLAGFSADGIHAGGYGVWMKYPAISKVAQQLYRKPPYQNYSAADVYDAVTNLRGNMLGTVGRTVAIGGNAVSVFSNTGTGTLTGTPPAGSFLVGTIDGTFSITLAQANCTALDTLFGTTGAQCVRMTVSGAMANDNLIGIQINASDTTQLNSTRMRGDALVNFNSMVGLQYLILRQGNGMTPIGVGQQIGSHAGTQTVADQCPTMNGIHEIGWKVTPTANSFAQTLLQLYFKAGVTASGSVDFIGMNLRRDDAIPAASP